jgi:hypothetical protein
MSVARLEFTWKEHSEVDRLIVNLRPALRSGFVRQIGSGPRKPAHCPECRSIIYSRRQRICGVCSQPLPDYLLFSQAEAQRVEQLLARERDRHRNWMEKRAEIRNTVA